MEPSSKNGSPRGRGTRKAKAGRTVKETAEVHPSFDLPDHNRPSLISHRNRLQECMVLMPQAEVTPPLSMVLRRPRIQLPGLVDPREAFMALRALHHHRRLHHLRSLIHHHLRNPTNNHHRSPTNNNNRLRSPTSHQFRTPLPLPANRRTSSSTASRSEAQAPQQRTRNPTRSSLAPSWACQR